jgi:hypothetical protein
MKMMFLMMKETYAERHSVYILTEKFQVSGCTLSSSVTMPMLKVENSHDKTLDNSLGYGGLVHALVPEIILTTLHASVPHYPVASREPGKPITD